MLGNLEIFPNLIQFDVFFNVGFKRDSVCLVCRRGQWTMKICLE